MKTLCGPLPTCSDGGLVTWDSLWGAFAPIPVTDWQLCSVKDREPGERSNLNAIMYFIVFKSKDEILGNFVALMALLEFEAPVFVKTDVYV